MLWPDSIAVADEALCVTVNQCRRSPVFNGGTNQHDPPFAIYRVPLEQLPCAESTRTPSRVDTTPELP